MTRVFEGSASGQVSPDTVLECGVCWWVFDPSEGDSVNDIAPGTAFADLPDHWRCPSCDADKGKFMVLDGPQAEHQDSAKPARVQSMEERVEALQSAYRQAQEAIVGLPVHNDALSVAAVGFRRHGEGYAGVIVTPWCMNLVCLPMDAAAVPPVALGATQAHAFPSGTYSFIMGRMDSVGMIETCSLFSPMDMFQSMEDAEAAAQAAVEGLFEAPEAEEEEAEKEASKTVTRRFLLTRNGAEA